MRMLNNNKSSMANHVSNPSTHDKLSGKVLYFSSQGKNTKWILDNEATNHIVCSPELLTNSKIVKNKIVKLPNGSLANVTHVGQVVFSPNLVLDNVLYLPIFHLNLISISKLTSYFFCITMFHTHFYVI